MVRVAFVSPSVSRTGAGIFEIARSLAQALMAGSRAQVDAYGLIDAYSDIDRPAWGAVPVHAFPAVGPRRFGYSPQLAAALMLGRHDVVHLHALWQYTSVAVLRYAQHKRVPSIITLNGMLDPWAVQHSRWKKRLALALYERRNLRNAACIQVNTEAEAASARAFGLTNPIVIIPNGVDLPDCTPPGAGLAPGGRKRLLYLGRLHPKKNLLALVEAVALLGSSVSGWQLDIVGWDEGGYARRIGDRISALGLEATVAVHGPAFGPDKEARLRGADAFVLPSLSEGLPMAVLEAWSYAKPVLMTAACNLQIGFASGAARQCGTSPEGIAAGLSGLLTMSDADRAAMGRAGRALVEARFSWATVAESMVATYRWALGQADAPPCLQHR